MTLQLENGNKLDFSICQAPLTNVIPPIAKSTFRINDFSNSKLPTLFLLISALSEKISLNNLQDTLNPLFPGFLLK